MSNQLFHLYVNSMWLTCSSSDLYEECPVHYSANWVELQPSFVIWPATVQVLMLKLTYPKNYTLPKHFDYNLKSND